ncbi:MAG: transposase [Qipengyuania sp.]
MARLPRLVLPGVPHHVTQRGNRRLPIFFSDDDRRAYIDLIAEGARASGTRCLAWCLMDNHLHLILVPSQDDGLRAMLGEAHRRYTRRINFREGWRGYLFQGRFASYPMDDAHLMAAIRYVENNPVAAGMVETPDAWPWSSARSHAAGRRHRDDPLTDLPALTTHIRKWRAYWRHGAGLAEASDEAKRTVEAIDERLRTGRPLAAEEWIARQEALTGRTIAKRKPGPKPNTGPRIPHRN